ncbi:aldo/keto reductase [Nocardia seriolae]|uniref:Oxidoreductase n=1 Tax=Nocardia seriolae TaxID=37332 RepID=A0ABC8AIS6_9NOCA|nr:aldo/keto reductase [Nocardia seriolae]APA94122.1 Pyridoxine 4-dehydrogenase [Nocardia seriolae]OJF83035.1 aldo/keto reductase [Nocardia seriolae]PSK26661.1 aldo/keto reductase [Nocardia seriolae]QOW32811.1 aldo/keto reductase [Nocardia seriolae]QUN20420.1 aldo/keto reductase [Nocardia seriolae]
MTKNLDTVQLGKTGPAVSRLALGAMGMSGMYGQADEAVSIATVHAAIDSGANLIDTGDFYGMGHNELLIRQALAERKREDVLLSVKYGALRGPDGSFGGVDTRPAATKNFLAYTLERLGTDYIDIYRPARLDPNVPIEETIGGLADMVRAGYIRHIGLSEVGAETLRRAAAVHPIVDLQIEYSLISRGIEAEILPVARELGIGITAYGVLSRGLLGGSLRPGQQFAPNDFRAHSPRFQGENFTANLRLVDALAEIAADHDVSVAQLAIAWVLSRGTDIVPLIGARKPQRWAEALAAVDIRLTDAELATIEAAVPADRVAGGRYAPEQMAMLDSER